MGVYIKDLAMPTSCNKCPFTCEKLVFFDGKNRPQGCPLIEIDLVRCGECMKHKNHNGKCTIWDRTTKRNFYCEYGERRADEHTD